VGRNGRRETKLGPTFERERERERERKRKKGERKRYVATY